MRWSVACIGVRYARVALRQADMFEALRDLVHVPAGLRWQPIDRLTSNSVAIAALGSRYLATHSAGVKRTVLLAVIAGTCCCQRSTARRSRTSRGCATSAGSTSRRARSRSCPRASAPRRASASQRCCSGGGTRSSCTYGLTYLSQHRRPTADKQLSNGAAGLLSLASKSRKSNPAGRSKEALHSVDRFVPDR